jgi:hypothetical protein
MPCALARHPVTIAKKQRSAFAPKNEATSMLENLAIREILQIDAREITNEKAIRLDFQGMPVITRAAPSSVHFVLGEGVRITSFHS